jgi:hypothetical protein
LANRDLLGFLLRIYSGRARGERVTSVSLSRRHRSRVYFQMPMTSHRRTRYLSYTVTAIANLVKTAEKSASVVRVANPLIMSFCSPSQDFRAVATYKTVRDHRTGRKCARCGGMLHDSIVNFGESLPAQALERAFQNAKRADLCLVPGSSLTVSPANEILELPC